MLAASHIYILSFLGVCDSDEFKVIDECVCPGYTTAVYKCTVVGNGFTQWAGSAFNCPNIGDEIFLSHPDFNDGIRKECNNGAIIGQSIQVNGSCFVSQLTVNISKNLNGTTIGCTYDTGSALEPIGATTLTSITGMCHIISIVDCGCSDCVSLTSKWMTNNGGVIHVHVCALLHSQ